MLEITAVELAGLPGCRLSGRLDGLTVTQAQAGLDDLVAAGQRTIVMDLDSLSYVSSAGLRVFLMTQKLLAKVGGRLIIFRPAPAVLQVFQLSGLLKLFDVAATDDELERLCRPEPAAPACRQIQHDGLAFSLIERQAAPTALDAHGSQDKQGRAAYDRQDVVAVPADGMTMAAGLGAFGETYDDYKQFFGESVVINGSFFYQPAVPRAGADCILNLDAAATVSYNFLHAFAFRGDYAAVCAFEGQDGPVELERLMAALTKLCPAPALGVVLLAESKGLWGMSLQKAPIIDNQPPDGAEIFSPDLFAQWMNFPVEPADFGHIVAGVGLAVAGRAVAPARLRPWLPADADFHLHAAVFDKGPLDKRPERFADELARVVAELEPRKVQHLLGRSRLTGGLAGLVALEV